MWNGFGAPEAAGHKSRVLDEWCGKVGRNPAEIERRVLFSDPQWISQAVLRIPLARSLASRAR